MYVYVVFAVFQLVSVRLAIVPSAPACESASPAKCTCALATGLKRVVVVMLGL